MSFEANAAAVPQLHRAPGTLDLVLLNVAEIVLCGGLLARYRIGAATPVTAQLHAR